MLTLSSSHLLWFALQMDEQPRLGSFSEHIVGTVNNGTGEGPDDILVIPDARADSRFRRAQLSCNGSPVTLCAGAPLLLRRDGEVYKIGALCVMETESSEEWRMRRSSLLPGGPAGATGEAARQWRNLLQQLAALAVDAIEVCVCACSRIPPSTGKVWVWPGARACARY